uniref:Uncharacterized protein n=1 Tax=Physcomitrium patens TaxID=3218 RepID=A0A2K1KE61_PHYPA|nr:hypothetical protein PHYPA_008432 [Physcomitrium patens]
MCSLKLSFQVHWCQHDRSQEHMCSMCRTVRLDSFCELKYSKSFTHVHFDASSRSPHVSKSIFSTFIEGFCRIPALCSLYARNCPSMEGAILVVKCQTG